MSLILMGSTSGSITLSEPAVAGSNTISLPAVTGTVVVAGQNSAITAGTAVASTSGTSIDFTSIPSWVKRVTVMFDNVSTSGTSNIIIQVGSGSVTTSGYSSAGSYFTTAGASASSTAGFLVVATLASTTTTSGNAILCLRGGNVWTASSVVTILTSSTGSQFCAGVSSALSGALDRVRITTANGTDTFDAGSINILYE